MKEFIAEVKGKDSVRSSWCVPNARKNLHDAIPAVEKLDLS